jgi:poly-gamma-glutamate system protein
MYTSPRLRLMLVIFAVASAVLYGGVWLIDRAASRDVQKLRAAQTLLDAERAIQSARGPQPESGPVTVGGLQAALLGPQTSPITTDAGSLPSKITATNPNFAAAIVDMLRGAHVSAGDAVAVTYTGSFPMLDLATIIAIESLDAEPIVVSSVGASNWGATDPSFTILDMESLLFERGFIRHRSVAAAVGGSLRRDAMSAIGRQLAVEAITRNGITHIDQTGLSSGVAERWRLYNTYAGDRPLKAFVNVGGGQISIGGKSFRDRFMPGLETPLDPQQETHNEGNGLLASMREAGVSTIHIDQVRALAQQYGLPVAPTHMPAVGEGGPFHDVMRIRVAAAIAALLLTIGLIGVRLLALTPSSEDQFDPYFGDAGVRARRRLSDWRPRTVSPICPQPALTNLGKLSRMD